MVGCQPLLKIMNYVCRVTSTKQGHWNIDLFIVVLDVDLHILLELQPSHEWIMYGIFIQNTAVENTLPWNPRSDVMSVEIHGRKHQSQKYNNQAQNQVAGSGERRLLGLHRSRWFLLWTLRQEDFRMGAIAFLRGVLQPHGRLLEGDLHHLGCGASGCRAGTGASGYSP